MKKNEAIENTATLNEILEVIGDRYEKRQLMLGNKVIASRVASEPVFYISKYKELFLLLETGLYLSISDLSDLNTLAINLGLDNLWEIEQYKMFVQSRNIITLAEDIGEDKNVPEGVYAANLETFYDYGINPYQVSNRSLPNTLRKINKYVRHVVDKNLKNPQFDQRKNFKDLVKVNSYEFDHVAYALNTDLNNNSSLSKVYERKLK